MTLFILLIIAVIAGNMLSHAFVRHDVLKLSTEIHTMEKKLLAKLDQIEKEVRHQNTYAEQAQKESARMQRIMEFHQRLMDRAKSKPTTAQE